MTQEDIDNLDINGASLNELLIKAMYGGPYESIDALHNNEAYKLYMDKMYALLHAISIVKKLPIEAVILNNDAMVIEGSLRRHGLDTARNTISEYLYPIKRLLELKFEIRDTGFDEPETTIFGTYPDSRIKMADKLFEKLNKFLGMKKSPYKKAMIEAGLITEQNIRDIFDTQHDQIEEVA